jgi:serine/threonine protein kinase
MPLASGTELGVYEITGTLGAGGMGEVYRANDTKLGREVAIKTLPASLASDKDRLARFEREAKLLASLNHAHIAVVHSLDEHEGTLYIAMELVEGESLEEKLKSGPLPIDDALRCGLQIAEALEAAHAKGVVHRDLKPANVMVTPDDVVKVLDFGLAKAFMGDPNEASPAHSPALSMAMTQAGLVLGTAGYMSPEQASGQATDQRADIWSFGVVLYEMLTGQPVFSGESVPHILAAVLQLEPDWSRLPKQLHPRLKQALKRCLQKKVRNRYHSIADVRIEIEEALNDPAATMVGAASAEALAYGAVSAPKSFRQRALPVAAIVVVTAALAAFAA